VGVLDPEGDVARAVTEFLVQVGDSVVDVVGMAVGDEVDSFLDGIVEGRGRVRCEGGRMLWALVMVVWALEIEGAECEPASYEKEDWVR
jgi:hypothetical protein